MLFPRPQLSPECEGNMAVMDDGDLKVYGVALTKTVAIIGGVMFLIRAIPILWRTFASFCKFVVKFNAVAPLLMHLPENEEAAKKRDLAIHEYQGKELLRQFNVPVPNGIPKKLSFYSFNLNLSK